jgi:hypothetical protein
MAIALQATAVPAGWLRNRSFDLGFIGGIAALALGSGAVVVARPGLFGLVLFLDLWLLGYQHVVATYTRLCFDRDSFLTHRFLILWLPLMVLAATVGLAVGIGPWALATLYLYWQWFHYTRQSWGISQAYRRKSDGLVTESERLSKLTFYLLPLWGILHRSHEAPATFLGMELKTLPVPELLVDMVGIAALVLLLWWLAGRLAAWWRGKLPLAHTLFVLSHFAIFYVGYVLIGSIDHGWLVLNVWHNAQYVAFVWLFNTNRFRGGIDPKARFLSMISQPDRKTVYFATCFGLSTALYVSIALAVDGFERYFETLLLPLALVVYQTINFHHYIVDGVIWKMRRKPIQETLRMAAEGGPAVAEATARGRPH